MSGGVSYDITRGMRDVILGALPAGVEFTSRATAVLEGLRQSYLDNVAADRLIVRLPDDSAGDVQSFQEAIAAVEWRDPFVDANAVRGLKFSAALPSELAVQTLGARIGDMEKAASVHLEERLLARGD